jgi:hypothetical protein
MKSLLTWLMVMLASPLALGFDEAAFIAGDDDGVEENANAEENAAQQHSNVAETGDGARQPLQFYGRFENQGVVLMSRNRSNQWQKHVYDYLQLRLDMDATLSKHIELKSDVVARLFAGDASFPLEEVVPPGTIDRALAVDARLASILEPPYDFENRAWLDNAYVKIPVGSFLVTVGKQPLGQGAGYVWNPTDIFVRKDLLDPTYEQEGIIAARLDVPMGAASLDLVVASPQSDFDNWVGGGRLKFPVGVLQFSAVTYYSRAHLMDVENAMDGVMGAVAAGQNPEAAIPVSNHKRLMVGGDVVVDVEGVRLWGEGAYNYLPGARDWWEAVGGLEYYFSFETHLMVEYFYYGRSPLPTGGSYSLNAWMNVLEGHLKMLGRHFLFESLEHPVADFWSLGLSSFQGLTDGSAIVEADVKWDFAQNAQLWLMAARGFGGREDFLSNSFQSWLRLTFYY